MNLRRIAATIVLLAATAAAGDISGKWSGSFKVDGGDHNVPQLFILKQQGKSLTGSGGPNASEQYPIENGRVDYSKVQFELTTGEWKFEYNLTQSSDQLQGSLKLKSTDETRNATVTLSKLKGE